MFPRLPARNLLKCFIVVCVITGLGLLAKGGYMAGKAQLAQYLIAHSWQDRGRQNAPAKPWPWADIHTVAKLEVPELETVQFIMNDASGEALAFGPGHLPTGRSFGDHGHTVIAGHRDSHFEFLKDIELGHTIRTEDYQGRKTRYQVIEIDIINSETEQIPLDPELNLITLVTCYPFEKLLTSGPLRYLVTAAEY